MGVNDEHFLKCVIINQGYVTILKKITYYVYKWDIISLVLEGKTVERTSVVLLQETLVYCFNNTLLPAEIIKVQDKIFQK